VATVGVKGLIKRLLVSAVPLFALTTRHVWFKIDLLIILIHTQLSPPVTMTRRMCCCGWEQSATRYCRVAYDTLSRSRREL